MKKILLATVFISIGIAGFAQQVDRGRILAGGAVNLNYGTTKVTTTLNGNTTTNKGAITFDAGLNPNVGIFLFKGFAAGLKFRADYSSTITNDSNKTQISNLNVGPFIRFYKKIGRIAPFVELSFGTGKSVSKTTINNILTSSSPKGSVIGVGPGISLFLTERLGIEAIATYEYLSSRRELNINNVVQKFLDRGNKLRLNIGVQMYL